MADISFTLALPPGISTDDTTFAASGSWADGSNCRFRGGRPETIGNIYQSLYTGLGGSVSAILGAARGASVDLYFGSTAKLWTVPVTGSGTSTDITPAGFASTYSWSLQMFGSYMLASPSGGGLYQYTGAGVATAVAVAPAAITSMIVTGERQVLALGCNEVVSGTFNGRCIRCSDLENYSAAGSWTPTSTNSADEIILDSDTDIVAGCVLGSYVCVWTAGALYLGQFIGDPSQTYRFDKVANVGLMSQKAFAVTPSGVYFLSPDLRLYSYNPGNLPAVVPCPVYNELVTNAERAVLAKAAIVAGYVPSADEVWIFYTDTRDGGASAVNSRYVAFAIRESAAAQRPVWFKGILGRSAVQSISALVNVFPQWTSACLMADASGNVHAHEVPATVGSTPASYIQSADQYVDQGKRRVMVKRLRTDFEYLSGVDQSGMAALTLYMRNFPGSSTVVTKGPYTLTIEASGYLVNASPASGATIVTIKLGTGGIAAGRQVTFAGVNSWESGADTGRLRVFTIAADFGASGPGLHLTEALIDSGGSRNVVALPAPDAVVTVLGTAAKKDLRASGMVISAKFSAGAYSLFRLGAPVFDAVTMGER